MSKSTPPVSVKPWRDTRVAARRKAGAKTKALLISVLYRVASQNRKDAIARKAPRYIGAPCAKHGIAEKYTASGHCIVCSREASNARRSECRRPAPARIAAGLPTRPTRDHPVTVGFWNSTERPDTVTVRAGYRLCTVCGRPISDTRIRSSTCSPVCGRAARAAINHRGGSQRAS